MANELLSVLAVDSIPDIARVVIITGEQVLARLGEGDRSDTAEDTLACITIDLAIRTDIEQTARRVIGTSTERVSIREELDAVDIGLVTLEGLDATLCRSVIPELCSCIARTRDKYTILICKRNRHHITSVIVEDASWHLCLHVPEDTGAITRRGDNLKQDTVSKACDTMTGGQTSESLMNLQHER